jgi:hypothetical protein
MKVDVKQVMAKENTPPADPHGSAAQLATSPSTNPQVLRKIATDPDWELRRLVAGNPNTPTDILWQLGVDFPEVILTNPIFKLLQLEQLNLVADIPYSTLTSLLQCESVPSNFLEYAVDLQDYSLWLAVAYNPHTPGKLLENLARKSRAQDRELIRAVAAHPQTPAHLLAEIIDIGGNVAQIVAENSQTPVVVLEKILRQYGQINDPIFVTLVALHPHITPRLAVQMHLAPTEIDAKSLWLAKQPTTTSAQLAELALTDWHILRLAIVRHPNTSPAIIERIWQQISATHTEGSQMDRLLYDSFVNNPQTSASLREELRKLLKW